MRKALRIQKNVIFALFIREFKTRFGGYRLGYLWALLEPSIQVIVFILMWSMTGRSVLNGVEIPVYLAVSMLPWFCAKSIITRSMSAIEANKTLFNYHYVKPIDTVLNRIFVEAVIYISIFLVFLTVLFILGYSVMPKNILLIITAWLLSILFATGFALFCTVIAYSLPSFSKVIGIFLTLIYFTSGIIFPIDILPSTMRETFAYNPVFQMVEFTRYSYFAGYTSEYLDIIYLLLWVFATLFIGMIVFYYNRFNFIRIR